MLALSAECTISTLHRFHGRSYLLFARAAG
jgi:hypothetical protein